MPNGGSSDARLLICRVGTKACGLPLEHVLETMRPLPVQTLPSVPPFVMGVAIVRGNPTVVLDARRLLGGSGASTPPGRFVSLKLGSRNAALLLAAGLAIDTVFKERQ